jgi:hypothetical protein
VNCTTQLEGKEHMYRSYLFGLLASSIGLVGVTQAVSQPACRPVLAIKDVRFSQMKPPTLERTWTAVLSVDASRCATTSGPFEIVFSRAKEIGIEIEFRVQFAWRPGAAEASVDFWADEAVERYWLGNVAACPCRD